MKNLIDKNSKDFSVKKVVIKNRSSMRNQLAAMHDKLVNTKFIEKNNNNIIETQVRKMYQ